MRNLACHASGCGGRRARLGTLLVLGALLVFGTPLGAGCASTDSPVPISLRSRATFQNDVWPVLVRDCGFPTCHGAPERFLRVLGPGHTRLDPMLDLDAPATAAEIELSYARALSMIDVEDPQNSELLLKPLETAAGGSRHEGTDEFGRDVYGSTDDPGFQVLRAWVLSPAGE